ncbi:MAG: flagellar hook-length control protein FliK [Amphritea sp.]|nr:flagellar hook-length control protein FliK [Amphritea sp.]
MNQSVAALNGAGSLLDLGSPVATGAAAPSTGTGVDASFDVMIAKAATGQSVDAGNSVPQDGENLPSQESVSAEGSAGGAAESADATGITARPDIGVTPEQIGEYRKADISVAVGSVLQQYRNGTAEEASAASAATQVSESVSAAVEGRGQQVAQSVDSGQSASVTVAAAGHRGDADVLAERQAQAAGYGQSVLSVADEKIAAVEASGRPGQRSQQSSGEERLAELRASLATEKTESVKIDHSAGSREQQPLTSAGSVNADVKGAGQARAPEQVAADGRMRLAEAQSRPAVESDAVVERVVPDADFVNQLEQKDQAAVQSAADDSQAVIRSDSAVAAQSPGVLQAVADKLRDQIKPVVVEGERSAVASEKSVQAQPINRETAQVVGEVKAETARPVPSAGPLSEMVRAESGGELRGRELAASLVSDAANSAKTDISTAEKSLAGFAETLAMANKSSKSVAETQQMIMPNGLKPGVPAWNQAVNERVMLLSSQNGRFAEIQLDPPELGSLQVKLQVKNEQVSVVFATPHAAVKDALEQGMPRLREMFEEQGMSLADSSVEDQSSGQQSDGESGSGYGNAQVAGSGAVAEQESADVAEGQAMSLVDYYA